MNHLRHSLSSYVLLLFACLAASAAAINSGSLWADEGIRIYSACKGLWEPALIWSCADKQLFFMLYEWVWSGVFPCTEVGLRSMNIPFFIMAVGYFTLILKRLNLSPFWALLLVLHPMVWYYLNDISPYMIILACGTGMLYHLFFAEHPEAKKHLIAWNSLFLIGFGSHFLFAFCYLLYPVACVARLRAGEGLAWKRHLAVAAVFACAYVPLAVLYAAHAVTGESYGWGYPGLQNVAYVLYGLAGFQGLSLSRADIRSGLFEHITPAMVVSLAVASLSCLSLVLLNLRTFGSLLKTRWVAALAVFAVAFAVVAFAVKFQFWERHYMVLLPAVLILTAQVMSRALARPGLRRTLSLAAFGVLMLCWAYSGLQLGFNEYHYKDDYKKVTAYLQNPENRARTAPLLAQGSYFNYSFYGWHCVGLSENFLRGYGLPMDSLILLDGVAAENQMKIICHVTERYGEVDILLSLRSPQTRGWEKELERLLTARGFQVSVTQTFNMFKLLHIKAPLNSSFPF